MQPGFRIITNVSNSDNLFELSGMVASMHMSTTVRLFEMSTF